MRKILPHGIAIAVFLIVAIVYCKPALDGKILSQSDVIGHKGMVQQSEEFNKKYGHYPLWTESGFSGMPTYTIMAPSASTILNYLVLPVASFNPIVLFFFSCLTFYLLMLVLRINIWLAVMSSLAFAYSTFDPVIMVVGHVTQMAAIGFMPLVIAGFLLITERKFIAGAAVFGISLGLQATITQHIQIVYYTIMVIGFIMIFFLIKCWREKQIKMALPAVLVALGAGLLGICMDAVSFLPVQEYAKETMRGGKSELTSLNSSNKTKGGLDKDYAFSWSDDIPETLTLLVPGAYGGGEIGKEFSDNSRFAEKLEEVGIPEANALQIANQKSYWGNQPIMAGPVYLGAIMCFLFLFGMLYLKSWHRGWIIAVTLFAILLAWGKNFASFNYFLFDYLPFYNKFRSPTMALVIPQITFPLLAAMGLNQLLADKDPRELIWKKFKSATLLTGAVLVLAGAFYFMSDYKSPKDAALKENLSAGLMQQMARGKQLTTDMQQQVNVTVSSTVKDLQADRQSLYGSDLLRTLFFIAIAVLLLGLYLKNKIKPIVLLAGLTLFSSYDLLAEGRKYLNEDSFIEPADVESEFSPSTADERIKTDPEKGFRVFDQTGDAFQNSHSSYFHNSIGGYSPAKLGLYQDIIENQLSKGNLMVFNMLNAKYFIRRNAAGNEDEAILNPNAFGPCWLVKAIHYVANADEEMKALDSINVRDTAIIQKRYQDIIRFLPVPDSTASIKLTENLNDKIDYQFSSNSNQFAVFSEVYYDKGWDAYIDGKKAAYCKVDYVLRGMPVPAGDHRIEFRFEPRSVAIGTTVSWLANIIGYILLFAAIGMEWRNGQKRKTLTDGGPVKNK